MRRRFLIPAIMLLLIIIAACQTAAHSVLLPEQGDYAAAMPTAAPMLPAAGLVAQESQDYRYADGDFTDQTTQTDDQPLPDGARRVVLKNAVLTVVVDDVDAKMAQINALAGEYGGWVVNAQVSHSGTGSDSRVAYAVITIRVAAERLDQALQTIKDGANQVENESITGQDVTQDYVDLSSQVANLQAAEKQLQEIMSRATKTEDVLSVYNELVRVRGEIEQAQGRLRYYDEASATSSIQVTLSPTPIVQPVEIGGWRPLETARNAFQALINLLQGAADVVITVAILGLPVLIFLVIPAWWVLRRRRVARAAS